MNRLRSNLSKDIQEIVRQIYFYQVEEDSPGVLQDLVRQVEELKKRFTNSHGLTDVFLDPIEITSEDPTDWLIMKISGEDFSKSPNSSS